MKAELLFLLLLFPVIINFSVYYYLEAKSLNSKIDFRKVWVWINFLGAVFVPFILILEMMKVLK
ncbi:MAG TPA: hypothetical protein PKE06_03960 [Flavilitoribacter sp.]|nr:hypothetical protein [Flavilitoribacter sp.]HMQ88371.1 hypothetical protein [Flavilitoribacter sp.]